MKRYIFSVFLLLFQFNGFCQPVLTNANNGIEPGCKRLLNYDWSVNPTYYPVQADFTDRIRRVWDFHDMTTYLGQWLVSSYCSSDSTKVNTLEGDCAIYTNDYIVSGANVKDTLMKFPFKFGDAFTSVYENNIPYKYGVRAVKADALGTLILPNGTYEEVLRVKTVHNYIDSTHAAKFYKMKKITYRWYSPLKREYLLVLDSSYITENSPVEGVPRVYCGYTSMFPLSIEASAQESEFAIYPNPSGKTVYIHCNSNVLQVIVKDVSGKTILNYNEKPEAIDLNVPGVYFITLTTAKESHTQKVIITG